VAAKLRAHIHGLLPGLIGYGLQLALQLVAQLLQLSQDCLSLLLGEALDVVHELVPLLLELLQERLHAVGQSRRRRLTGRNDSMCVVS
jgi:hypothetical protein